MKKLLLLAALFSTTAHAADLTVKADAITTNSPTKTKVDVKKNLDLQTTGGLYLPSGTTAQQPTPYKDGMIRYNSTEETAEIYINGLWAPVGGSTSIADWVTATDYEQGDFVIQSLKLYRALLNHTSTGSFATDLANGNWEEISGQSNLTGMITSVGTVTSLGSFTSANLTTAVTDETGSGALVFGTSPTLATPVIGAATGTSLNASGTLTGSQLISNVATGTAPLSVASTTVVPNLYVARSVIADTMSMNYTARTSAYSAVVNDYVNVTSGTFAVTLPTAVGISGQAIAIKNSGTGVVTINTTSAQTVDGNASATITIAAGRGALIVVSNGANWVVSNPTYGVATAPGVLKNMDTFAVTYGAATIANPCASSPCTIAQNTTAVTSITRAGAGDYALNTARTYASLFCSLSIHQNSTASVGLRAQTLHCTNCSSVTWVSGIAASASYDTGGTLMCQGTY